MAGPALRLPENVPGDFFVDSTCIDCDACRISRLLDHSFEWVLPGHGRPTFASGP